MSGVSPRLLLSPRRRPGLTVQHNHRNEAAHPTACTPGVGHLSRGSLPMTETYAEIHDKWEPIHGWATIDYADSIGGYEWDQFRVMRGPDGLLYVADEGGCSCNYFGQDGPSGFVRVDSWQEAVKRLGEWVRDGDYAEERRRTVADELRSRLAADRPRKRIAHDPSKGFAR